ncbi:MAG: hypothetical protein IMW95_11070, partial [Moorella humiferrea]|nr:hypothetical protein [Moorella humiferrea]
MSEGIIPIIAVIALIMGTIIMAAAARIMKESDDENKNAEVLPLMTKEMRPGASRRNIAWLVFAVYVMVLGYFTFGKFTSWGLNSKLEHVQNVVEFWWRPLSRFL